MYLTSGGLQLFKCISEEFTSDEFALVLQQLTKPAKAPGPDFICSEHDLNAGSALKSWLNNFLSSCLQYLKITDRFIYT